MKKLNPNLMVKDVKVAIEFYTKNLDFEVVMSVPKGEENASDPSILFQPFDPTKSYVYALVKNGDVTIAFQEAESLKEDVAVLKDIKIGYSGTFYIEMDDVENFYNQIKDKVEIIKDLYTAWYGMKEFYIRDNSGYILCFAQNAS